MRGFYGKSSFCSAGAFYAAANCCAAKNISLLDTAAVAVSVFLLRIGKPVFAKVKDSVKITGVTTDVFRLDVRSRVKNNLSVPI